MISTAIVSSSSLRLGVHRRSRGNVDHSGQLVYASVGHGFRRFWSSPIVAEVWVAQDAGVADAGLGTQAERAHAGSGRTMSGIRIRSVLALVGLVPVAAAPAEAATGVKAATPTRAASTRSWSAAAAPFRSEAFGGSWN